MDDTKPKSVPKSVSEHPISEAEAKKYAGAGDFSLPTQASPLDNLIGTQVKTAPPAAASVAKPETPAAAPMPVPSSASTKDLEKKAKELLKGTDTKPIKKKRSRTATTMALAAVLMVMMGAGGIAGMNLLKMQQVAENRSQAWTEGAPWCEVSDNDKCTIGRTQCQSQNGANTGYKCTCVDLSPNNTCNKTVWSCGAYDPDACPPENADPVGCSKETQEGVDKCCSNNTCDLGSNYGSGCYVNHFFSPDNDTDPVVVSNCHTQPNEGNVQTLACAVASASFQKDCGAEQIDIECNGYTAQISRRYPTDCVDEPPPTEPPPTAPPPTEPPPTEPPPTEPPPTAEPMSCIGIDPRSPTGLTVGSVAEFTCAGTGTGLTYNFRVRVNGGTWTEYINDDGLDSAGGQLIFAKQGNNLKFRINQAGAYDVECRACTGRAGAGCTTWGLAQ